MAEVENSRVSVSIRIRPKLENAHNITQISERYHPEAASRPTDGTVRLCEAKGKETKSYSFGFDYVFDKESSQVEVYEDTTLEAVDAALQGCNATVIAYGQTGSGKTYTVLGTIVNNPLLEDVMTSETGLFLRALKDILSYVEGRAHDLHVVLALSITEIYLDSVRDLLSSDPKQALRMIITQDNVMIPDLTFAPITHIRDAVAAFKVAMSRRVSRATDANDQSSRSHAVFAIDIFQQRRTSTNPEPISLEQLLAARDAAQQPGAKGKPLEGMSNSPLNVVPGHPPVIYSRMTLTDLAGSEKLKHSNAKGEALQEMINVNGSLTSLGNVVHSLHEGAKHIPYRDSKLTMILRTSFAAPNGRVALIANISPTDLTYEESLSTLFFANKVKTIKVGAISGGDLRAEGEYYELLRAAEEMGADMRILQEVYGTRLNVRSSAGPNIFNPKFGVISVSAPKNLRERYKDVIARLVEKYGNEQESKKGVRNEEALAITNETISKRLAEHDEAVNYAMRALETMSKETSANTTDWDSYEKELAAENQEANKELNAVINQVAQLKHQLATLPTTLTQANREFEKISREFAALEAKYLAVHGAVEEQWTKEKKSFEAQDIEFNKASDMAAKILRHWKLRERYLEAVRDCNQIYKTAVHTKIQAEYSDIYDWIHRAVVQMAKNAVVISHRQKTGRAPPKVPMKRPAGPPASGGSFRKGKGPPQPSSPVPAPKRPPPPRHVTTLYDEPNLLGDIFNYMAQGVPLLKHGRSGSPHLRFFYTLTYTEEEAEFESLRLCWNEDTSHKGAGGCVYLGRVHDVVLGQFSEVFQRQRTKEGFYESFSIHYIKNQEPRTLDIVCESLAEMEAWVIGICSVCCLNPRFGEPLSIEADGLSPVEAATCRTWHIQPRVLVAVKERLATIAAKRGVEIPKITPGELRYISQMDIFRASALWDLLKHTQRLVPPSHSQWKHYLSFTTTSSDGVIDEQSK